MHEMSLAQGIVRQLEEQAQLQRFSRVWVLRLEIGPLAAVDAEALRFCFDVVTQGTLAEGAQLEIDAPHATARCLECGVTQSVVCRYNACTDCGSYRLQLLSGDQMNIKALEVE